MSKLARLQRAREHLDDVLIELDEVRRASAPDERIDKAIQVTQALDAHIGRTISSEYDVPIAASIDTELNSIVTHKL